MMTEISNKLLPLIFLFIGVALLIVGTLFYTQLKNKLKKGIKTNGEIANVRKERTRALQGADELSDIYYKYEITYKDFNNNKITKWSDFQTQSKYEIGSYIEVIYDKNNPEDFIIFPSSQKRLFIIFICIGFVFSVIGLLIWIYKG